MSMLSVWAPRATSVAAVAGRDQHLLAPVGGGWFRGDVPLEAGDDYAFSLDGGPPRPDPRSHRQPHGVHGPSQLVDHGAFAWSDGTWHGRPLAGSVVYELHVGTFTPVGTFDGVIERLDHLVDLGVGFVELMPVAAFPGRWGWGYDGVHLFAPFEGYGGPDALKRLVDACHARGLGVLLDVVFNHLGPSGNYLREFGPYFTDRHHTPWGEAVNLDGPDSDEVRAFLVACARHWLEHYHLDGLRLDATHELHDETAFSFLEQLAEATDALEARLARQVHLIAENDRNDPRLVTTRDAGGIGLDAVWADDFHHAVHTVLTGEREGYYAAYGEAPLIMRALQRGFVYDRRASPTWRRTQGRPVLGLPGHRFVACIQNHDQVGNRARGERLGHLAPFSSVQAAAALLLCAPQTPMLFQGEEWGASSPFTYFTDHDEPDVAVAVAEGRKREFAAFGWAPQDVLDPQDPETFHMAVLDWAEVGRERHAAMLRWYRDLIALRRRWPELTDGRFDLVDGDVVTGEGGPLVVVRRGRVLVAANLGDDEHQVRVPSGAEPVLASGPGAIVSERWLRVPPRTTVVVTVPAEELSHRDRPL